MIIIVIIVIRLAEVVQNQAGRQLAGLSARTPNCV